MSDKMITPEEYLIENPTALIFRHEISKAGQSTAMTRPGNGEGWKYSEADILIDWTGYTEELRVDVIDTIGHIDYGDKADSLVWDYWYCQSDIIGWRPHFKEKN
jgi:hypothetical protein